MKYSYFLLWLGVVLTLSCTKVADKAYNKTTVQLNVVNKTGSIHLEWDRVNSGDFVAYEIYRSSNDNIDIITATDKLIKTINKSSDTSFTDDLILQEKSISNNSTIYYKVAVVLTGRKLASNLASITCQKNIVTNQNYTIITHLPEKDLLLMRSNTTSELLLYNYVSNKIIASKLFNGINIATLAVYVGANDSGYLAYADVNQNIQIVDLLTLTAVKTIYTSINGSTLQIKACQNHIYLLVSSQNFIQFTSYNIATEAIEFFRQLSTFNFNVRIQLSNNKNKLYILSDVYSIVYDVDANGTLSAENFVNTSVFGTQGSDFAVAWNGNFIATYPFVNVYNSNFQPVANFGNINNAQALAFTSNNKIVLTSSSEIQLLDIVKQSITPMLSLSTSIGFTQPLLYSFEDNNQIYIFLTLFDNFTFNVGETLYITKPLQ